MTRRYRRLAALMVLVAFSGYCAEGVLAAFCAPGSAQHAAPAVHASHGPAGSAAGHDVAAHGHASPAHGHAGGSHHGHDVATHGHAGAAHGHEGAADGPAGQELPAGGPHHSHCPFGMAGGVSCTAVSLPGHGVAVVPLPASSERNVVPPQVNIPLLLDRSLYHPPRA